MPSFAIRLRLGVLTPAMPKHSRSRPISSAMSQMILGRWEAAAVREERRTMRGRIMDFMCVAGSDAWK